VVRCASYNKWYYHVATIYLHSSAIDCYLISTNKRVIASIMKENNDIFYVACLVVQIVS